MKLYKINYHTWVTTDTYVFENPGIFYCEAENILEAQKDFLRNHGNGHHIDAITEMGDKEIKNSEVEK